MHSIAPLKYALLLFFLNRGTLSACRVDMHRRVTWGRQCSISGLGVSNRAPSWRGVCFTFGHNVLERRPAWMHRCTHGGSILSAASLSAINRSEKAAISRISRDADGFAGAPLQIIDTMHVENAGNTLEGRTGTPSFASFLPFRFGFTCRDLGFVFQHASINGLLNVCAHAVHHHM